MNVNRFKPIKTATRVTLVALILSFILGAAGTLLPGIIIRHRFLYFSTLIHLLAALLVLRLFLLLRNIFSGSKHKNLSAAWCTAIAGTAVTLPIYLRDTLLIYQVRVPPFILLNQMVDLILSLCGASAMLYFSVVFYRRIVSGAKLKDGFRSAITAYILLMLIYSSALPTQIFGGKPDWLLTPGRWLQPGVLLARLFILRFFWVVHRKSHALEASISLAASKNSSQVAT